MPVASRAKVLLVGEANPYGGDPHFALYPSPDGCAGHRLCCLVMGLARVEYLERFDRVNLCPREWSARQARERARELWGEAVHVRRPAVVLLGRKVASCFQSERRGVPPPFTWTSDTTHINVVYLPHPSGLCREWNAPGAFERARAVLREAEVLPWEDR